jgi:hypothetical protein
MADFRDKKIRMQFAPGGLIAEAGAEDLALLIACARPLLERALERVRLTADATNVVLDPLPTKEAKDAKPPKALSSEDEAAD